MGGRGVLNLWEATIHRIHSYFIHYLSISARLSNNLNTLFSLHSTLLHKVADVFLPTWCQMKANVWQNGDGASCIRWSEWLVSWSHHFTSNETAFSTQWVWGWVKCSARTLCRNKVPALSRNQISATQPTGNYVYFVYKVRCKWEHHTRQSGGEKVVWRQL